MTMTTTVMTPDEPREDHAEAGMATAEYAIGTVSATSFAGLLLWLIKQDWLRDALTSVFQAIFNF